MQNSNTTFNIDGGRVGVETSESESHFEEQSSKAFILKAYKKRSQNKKGSMTF
jgi:hypothetical protein